jgi:HPt (histidine-containing phosphotransfer) domain-containing protein
MYACELSYLAPKVPLDCVPLDAEQLDQNTFGDRALRTEILQLFVSQLDISRDSILNPINNDDWRFSTHTLKGAAAAVGAQQFVALSAKWEKTSLPFTDKERENRALAFDQAREAFLDAALTVESRGMHS